MRTWTLNFLIWWFKLLTNTDAYLKIICILRPSTSSLNLFRAINSTIIYGPIRFLTDSSGHEVLVKIFVLERIFQYWNSGHFVKYLESQRFAARFQSIKGFSTANPNQEHFWTFLKYSGTSISILSNSYLIFLKLLPLQLIHYISSKAMSGF